MNDVQPYRRQIDRLEGKYSMDKCGSWDPGQVPLLVQKAAAVNLAAGIYHPYNVYLSSSQMATLSA